MILNSEYYRTQKQSYFCPSDCQHHLSSFFLFLYHPDKPSSHLSDVLFFCIFAFHTAALSWNEGFEINALIILPHVQTQTEPPIPRARMQTQTGKLITVIKKQAWIGQVESMVTFVWSDQMVG